MELIRQGIIDFFKIDEMIFEEDLPQIVELIKEIDKDYDEATNALKVEKIEKENDELVKNIKED